MINRRHTTIRRVAWPLVLALAVVQFALVQHDIDHAGQPGADTFCGLCVTGHAPAAPPARAGEPAMPAAVPQPPAAAGGFTIAVRTERAHPPRAPPRYL